MIAIDPSAFPAQIKTLDEWRRKWPPAKSSIHWKAGRSAMELGRLWMEQPGAIPACVQSLFENSILDGFSVKRIKGEHRQVLDKFGGPRNVDLMLEAYSSKGEAGVIHFEAKCDETFANTTVEQAWHGGLKRSQNSGIPQRICQLSNLLFETKLDIRIQDISPAIRELRYQLLSGVAAAVLQAGFLKPQKAQTAVFVVHEFLPFDLKTTFYVSNGKPWTVKPKNVEKNRRDLEAMLGLFGVSAHPTVGTLVELGEFYPPTDSSWTERCAKPVKLQFGKLITDTTAAASLTI